MKGIINFSEIEFSQGKVLPSCVDVERDVLGEILSTGDIDTAHSLLLTSEAFYKLDHREIYEACLRLSQNFKIIDTVAIVQELHKVDKLEFCGSAYGITALTNNYTGAIKLERNCLLMREDYIRRSLIAMAPSFWRMAFDKTSDIFDVVDYIEMTFDSLVNQMSSGTHQTAATIAAKVILDIEQLMNHDVELTGVPTGYEMLTRATCGWQPTDLIILAARPSVGKTAFALNLARNAAKAGEDVGFFSLEMSNKQLVKRLLSTATKIRFDKINRGRMSLDEFQSLLINAGHEEFKNIVIDDSAGLNIFEFRSKARKMVKMGCKLIIVDYLQLMSGSGKEGNREGEISAISRGMKKTAKELNVPIIALSQLSRAIESRASGEPQLSDLRESGAIEQDADIVGFLTREDYQADMSDIQGDGKGFLKIKKHRNGPLIDIPFITRFQTQEWIEDQPF